MFHISRGLVIFYILLGYWKGYTKRQLERSVICFHCWTEKEPIKPYFQILKEREKKNEVSRELAFIYYQLHVKDFTCTTKELAPF